VTLLQSETDTVGIDVEVPNNIESIYLIEELLKKVNVPNGADPHQYDIEFSLTRSDWQKVEKQYSFLDVGVYDGVYIQVVKSSKAVSAPRITPDFSSKPRNLAPRRGKKAEEKQEPVQSVQNNKEQVNQQPKNKQEGYAWKVID
jgi:hypothetical protein